MLLKIGVLGCLLQGIKRIATFVVSTEVGCEMVP